MVSYEAVMILKIKLICELKLDQHDAVVFNLISSRKCFQNISMKNTRREMDRPPKSVCNIPDKCCSVICLGPVAAVLKFRYFISMLIEAQCRIRPAVSNNINFRLKLSTR